MNKITAHIIGFAFSTLLLSAGCKEGDGGAPKPGDAPSGGAKPASSAQAPAAGAIDSGLPECDAYAAVMNKFMACEGVPQAAKDGYLKQFEATKQSWSVLKDPSFPTASKKTYADACKQGETTVRDNAKLLNCAL